MGKKILAIVLVLIIAFGGVGGYFAYQKYYLPLKAYNNAVSLYEDGKYSDAIKEFSHMIGYKDSRKYIYDMYKLYAGEDFVNESTHALAYLNSCIESTANKVVTEVYSGNTDGSLSVDTSSSNYISMRNSASNLEEMKAEFDDLFTNEIIDACNDEKLKSAKSNYIQLFNDEIKMYNELFIANAIVDMINGSGSSYETSLSLLETDMESYSNTYKELGE